MVMRAQAGHRRKPGCSGIVLTYSVDSRWEGGEEGGRMSSVVRSLPYEVM
jgi:hypothetical protein